MTEGKRSIEFAHDLLETYNARCKPLCRKTQLSQTALDILMFLANNPEYNTARDITEYRGIKANLVSINVDKLVREGLLERIPDTNDRRKNVLICTEKAGAIIQQGRQVQGDFFRSVFAGIDTESLRQFFGVIQRIRTNLDTILKEGNE